MNKIKLLGLALVSSTAVALCSCDDYLEVKLNDQMTIEEVFSKRESTLNYLRHVYSYLPSEHEYQGSNSITQGGDGSVVAMADESLFSWYQWVTYLDFRTGDNSTSTWAYNNWADMYKGIEQAGIFMEHVDECGDMTANERKYAKAEARLIRAYCYFQLFRRYGPVFVWGDQRSNQTIKPEEIDRHTVDQNLDFMVTELDKCIEDLPLDLEDMNNFAGRATKGAAMALKSRLLLYAASPLYNGCDLYKGQMINKDGNYLFPQTPDPNKWELAAQAAKAIIDLGKYELLENTETGDPVVDGWKAYTDIQNQAWNKEVIWGYWPGYTAPTYYIPCFNRQRMLPPGLAKNCNGGYCASLKLVDAYPMQETGRYPYDPVKGYKLDSDGYFEVDPASGYEEGKDKINFENNFVSGWEHPIEGPKFGAVKAHKSCVGRDARYYASIQANGFRHVNNFLVGGNQVVTFYTGGTSSYNPNDCVKSGFLWRRFLDVDIDYDNGNYGTYFYWYFRLAEIYLNYAEACNEKPNREASEALTYLNKVRNRAGLNNIEEAYPEYNFLTDQNALRMMIRQERMVELAFESHRYYDCRRWMTAVDEFTNKNWTLDLIATNYEASWVRTTRVWAGKDNKFTEKNYFFPINQTQLSEMKNITQNYGW